MEALTNEMSLRPDMRVLDMGCGKAISSIFLAKEFGVRVWATDLWIPATDNWKRIRRAGVHRVFPVHAEAHDLPFADGFFDAIVSVDAYHYFGTDVHRPAWWREHWRRTGIVEVRSSKLVPEGWRDWLLWLGNEHEDGRALQVDRGAIWASPERSV